MEGIKAVDWFGSIAIIGALSMPLLGLNFGGELFPWNSPRVICLIVSGCTMLGIFVFSQARLSKYPLMPLKLFQRKSNVACVVIGFTQLFVGHTLSINLTFKTYSTNYLCILGSPSG